jgi:hypothetical protein
MKVAVVSVCQKIRPRGGNFIANFHFLGHFAGTKLKGVEVAVADAEGFILGEGYLLYLEVLAIENQVLKSTLIYHKKLSEVYCV